MIAPKSPKPTKNNNKRVQRPSPLTINNKLLGNFKPIAFLGLTPSKYAGFTEKGIPAILTETKNGMKRELLSLKGFDHSKNEGILNKIRFARNDEGNLIAVVGGEVFTKEELAKRYVFPADESKFMACLSVIPVSEEVYRQPSFFMTFDFGKNVNFLLFPEHFFSRRSHSFESNLMAALRIGAMDTNIYNEGMSLLRKFPAQLSLYYAVIGGTVVNLLSQFVGVNDFGIVIQAIGEKDTGKSFGIKLALKFAFGLDDSYVLGEDAIDSSFRHHGIADSTNLPVYIEEAIIRNKGKLKTLGKNLRGTKDQKINIFENRATFVLSMNTELVDENNTEEEAVKKRFATYRFGVNDTVPQELQKDGKYFLMKIKEMPGGFVYDTLSKKSTEELIEIYMGIVGNTAYRISKFGSLLCGNEDFHPMINEKLEDSVKERFESLVRFVWDKIQFANGDRLPFDVAKISGGIELSDSGVFKIKLFVVSELLRMLNLKMEPKTFAALYGYAYNTYSFNGTVDRGIRGILTRLKSSEPDDDKDKTNPYKDKIEHIFEGTSEDRGEF